MCNCEDRPCCGHLAEERADDAYQAERANAPWYEQDDYYEADDDVCDACYEEECECDTYAIAEDCALESSLFGDC